MMLRRFRPLLPLIAVLAIGLILRVLLWGKLPRTGFISDEGEYLAAATWLAEGRNFSWYNGYLWTRAPLYPLFVASHLALFGQRVEPIYLSQILLSLINVVLVYALALRLQFSTRVANVAALFMALYLPFALYPQVLLSETLFIALILGSFLALAIYAEGSQAGTTLVLAGILLGLATLTRSLTLGFLPLVALWLIWLGRRTTQNSCGKQRLSQNIRPMLVVAATALALILPWTAYNSRLYGGLIAVDTTGAFNLMLGARTAHDDRRADAPPRNFVLALLGQLPEPQRSAYPQATIEQGGACLASQGDEQFAAALARAPLPQAEVQRLMTAEAVCLIQRKPLAFLAKTAGELLDFFQINYSGDERFTNNFTTGRLPPWYPLALFLLDDTLYVLALPLAALGFGIALTQRRTLTNSRWTTNNRHYLVLIWLIFNIAVAPVLFAINRFRLPLLPFVFIFAAYGLVHLSSVAGAWWRSCGGRLATAIALLLLLVAATPYAYFEPGVQGVDATWASYLGPYPSSIDSTFKALAARPDFLQQETMRLALRNRDTATAQAARPPEIRMQRLGKIPAVTNTVLVDALFAAAAGRPAAGLALLPNESAISAAKDVEAAVVRGDLLRSLSNLAAANAALGQTFVDNANPVEWAWDWLAPVTTTMINVGGNIDLGYLHRCYLGEGEADANYRWCGDGAELRFPGAGTGAAQTLRLRADGRGWRGHAAAVPPVRVLLNGVEVGRFTPSMERVQVFSVDLPATANGATVLITLHTPTFIDSAADYNRQQGPLAGQVRQLGVRLDWAELR